MARAYYNEIDPYCVEWLRALIAAGHIAPGDVDARDIRDVRPDDLEGYDQCHFFAGLGGWSRALRLAGVPDGRKLWTGSCPCQPFSAAGKRKGFADERHLWPFWHWLITQRRPPVVFGEQVASAAEWLRLVRGDLEALEYAVGCAPIEAASAGADHLRDRFWFVADADQPGAGEARQQRSGQFGGAGGDPEACGGGDLSDSDSGRQQERPQQHGDTTQDATDRPSCRRHADGHRYEDGAAGYAGNSARQPQREPNDEGDTFAVGGETRRLSGGAGDPLEWVIGADGKARRVKPGIRLLAHGIPARVAKLRAFGNAIDPRPAAAFIDAFFSGLSVDL